MGNNEKTEETLAGIVVWIAMLIVSWAVVVLMVVGGYELWRWARGES